MGIKTKISKKQLPKKYQKYNLIETIDGISDSVYLLDDIYVLKIFELQTGDLKNQIINEKKLLDKLKDLEIPKVVDIFKIEKRFAVIYTQIIGKSIKKSELIYIKQISLFLKKLHSKTQNIKSTNIVMKNKLSDYIDRRKMVTIQFQILDAFGIDVLIK